MPYLRLAPTEYATICRHYKSLNLGCQPLHTFRQLLLTSLAATCPELMTKVAKLNRPQLQLLHVHLQPRQQPTKAHGLTSEEVGFIISTGIPLISNARFARLLKYSLVCLFKVERPELATKLERLSLSQFEELCGEV